ncbi:MAG: shikimate dehydrogenase [Euryarchaeota archaeon]
MSVSVPVDAETKVVGLVGHPVEHSLSPPMHNAAFRELGLNYVYVAFDVPERELETAIMGAQSLGIVGLNVTIPHKERALRVCDTVDRDAELIGAVNTLRFRERRVEGYNTDGEGFLRALKEEVDFDPEGVKAVILGAGGAARAVTFKLATEGADELVIANRTYERGERLARELEEKTGVRARAVELDREVLREELRDARLLVDATPVGMHPNEDEPPLVTAREMHEDLIVNDLVYNPPRTRLLEEAERAGATPVDGLGMLVHQGALAFELWTGREAPVDVMREAVLERL